MIVLDEQLEDPRIATAIARWYPGKVINIVDARRDSEILDEVGAHPVAPLERSLIRYCKLSRLLAQD